MSGWARYTSTYSRSIDKKKGSKSTTYQAKEYYGVVIGGECLQPDALRPQTAKRDEDGEYVKSNYGNGLWLIDMDNAEDGDYRNPTPDRFICKNWRTPREVLDSMDPKERAFIGAVKKWLLANEVSVVHHSGNTDMCSQFGGQHLHVLVKSPKALSGSFIDPHNTSQYKAVKRACSSTKKPYRKTPWQQTKSRREESSDEDGFHDDYGDINRNNTPRFYFKYEGLRSVEKFIQYCHQAPRLFLGASSKDLLRLRRKCINKIPVDGVQFLNTDIFEPDVGGDDSDREFKPRGPKRYCRGDLDSDDEDDRDDREGNSDGPTDAKRPRVEELDPDKSEKLDPKHRESDSGEDIEERNEDEDTRSTRGAGTHPHALDDRNAVLTDFDIKQTGIKYLTKSVRCQNMILKIMDYLCAYDKESITYEVGKLDMTKAQNKRLFQCWRRILAEGAKGYVMKARDQLKPILYHETFYTIAEKFAMSERWKDPQYTTVDDSIDILADWCEFNSIDWAQLISATINVMDKKSVKKNTIMILGPSNGGKSVVYSVPLQTLVPLKCMLSSAGNASQFLWDSLPGNRACFMEEASITQEHQNTAKKVLGGEECSVNVKHEKDVVLKRTPVIMTCNDDPFYMVQKQCDRIALRNRVYAFSTKEWPEFKLVEEQVNPGMWYKILKASNATGSAITEEEIPSPEEIKAIPMPRPVDFQLTYEEQ